MIEESVEEVRRRISDAPTCKAAAEIALASRWRHPSGERFFGNDALTYAILALVEKL